MTAPALASALAGCGGFSSGTGPASKPSTTVAAAATCEEWKSVPAGDAYVAFAHCVADRMRTGITGDLPLTAPRPAEGKDVWVISFLEADPGGHVLSEGTKEAVEAAGWTPTVFDGAGDPSKWQAGINQAVAAGADAIILLAFDCSPVKGPLQAAKSQGIKVAGVYAGDCKEDPQIDVNVTYAGLDRSPIDYTSWAQLIGLAKGWLIVDETEGRSNTLAFTIQDLAAPKAADDKFLEDVAKCADCTVTTVPVTLSEVGQGVTAKAQAALLQHPDANSAFVSFDGVALSIAPAIVGAGKQKSIFAVGNEGNGPTLDLIRNGRGLSASMGIPHAWSGWAAVDGLVRSFAGQEPVPSGMGLYAIDATNVPSSGGFEAPVDFRKNYRDIWAAGR
jgi:ribose transport system substrate-binding protein